MKQRTISSPATLPAIGDHNGTRLERLGERDKEDRLAAGWKWCEEHEVMVPPGWMRDPDYVAPPEAPLNMCEGQRLGLTFKPPSG
ncbi:MAG: hypothetical protein ABI422_00250 [Sphingomicrobium sp.]